MTFRSLYVATLKNLFVMSWRSVIDWGNVVHSRRRLKYGLLSGIVSILFCGIAYAADLTLSFNIPQQAADDALPLFGQQANVSVIYPFDLVEDHTTNALLGEYSIDEAVAILLNNTGLQAQRNAEGHLIITQDNKTDEVNSMGTPKKNKLLAAIVSFFIGVGGAQHVEAQEEASQDDSKLMIEEIMVTASRRVQNLQDVPMAITIVSPEEFTGTGITTLDEVIGYTPGFNASSNDGGRPGVGSFISARGVGVQGLTSVVGVYVDDVPFTSNSPSASVIGLSSFDGLLGDIERIELLKGPQGTLYGATSVGGAIKYITRKPMLNRDEQDFQAHGSVNLSSTEEGGFNKLYNGRVSTPIIEDRLGVTLAGFYEDNAGFVDRVDAATSTIVGKNQDKFERYGISGDLYFQVTDDFDIRLKILTQRTDYTGGNRVGFDINTLEPLNGKYEGTDGLGDNFFENNTYSGTLEYRFDGMTLISTSSYVDVSLNLEQDFSFLAPIINGLIGTQLTSLDLNSPTESEKIVQEIRLVSNDEDKFEWLVGLYYTDEKTERNLDFVGQPDNFNWSTVSAPSSYEEYAAFGNLTYYITPNFDLTIGARISKSETNVESFSTGAFAVLTGDTDVLNISAEDTVDTWLFAARFRPREDMSLYARVASGYRPGFANILAIDPTGVKSIPDFVEPDTLWSYEIGAKGDLNDGIFSYDIALWYLNWDDFQTLVVGPLGNALSNAREGITAKGVEGAFILTLFDGLSINSSITYTDSALNENDPAIDGLSGQQVPFVPEWTASTKIRYEFSLTSGIDAHIGGGFRYESESRTSFEDGSAFRPGIDNLATDGPFDGAFNVPKESRVVVDLDVGIDLGDVSVNLYATNLFNEYELSTARGSTATGLVRGTPIRPRTVGAVLSFDY